jgi:hypothetical protein
MSRIVRGTSRDFLALAGFLFLSACGDPPPGSVHGEWSAEREERGDTLIVRTLSGSMWGDTMVLVPEVVIGELDGDEAYLFGNVRGLDVDSSGRIWVVDGQAAELRLYSPEGRHLRTIGRRGEGPGEFLDPDIVRIRDDGSLLVRDQRNARFSILGSDGEHLGGWPIAGGFSTSSPFHLTDGGSVLNPALRNRGADISEWRMGLVRYGPDGEVRDTLDLPTRGYRPPTLIARSEQSASSTGVPFTPQEMWTVTPDGSFVFGLSSGYRVEKHDPEGPVLAVEREAPLPPVLPDEARNERERIIRNFRARFPDWRWQGPDVPGVKPAFRNLLPGRDGTVWVLRFTLGKEEDDPDWDADRPDQALPTRWVEPMVFDVFDGEGRYLGPVKADEPIRYWTPPVLTRDRVWAVWPHELGYDRVARFRLEPASVRGPASGRSPQKGSLQLPRSERATPDGI